MVLDPRTVVSTMAMVSIVLHDLSTVVTTVVLTMVSGHE